MTPPTIHATQVAELEAQVATLTEALAVAERDAARYRYLRGGRLPIDEAKRILNDTPDGIDMAVDAARAQEKAHGVA